MNRASSILLLLYVAVAFQAAPTQKIAAFRWSSREAQELVTGRDALAASRDITDFEKARLLDALTIQFRGSSEPRKRAAKTRVKLVDLNGDGVPEVFCQAVDEEMCSPTGNCSFWLFQKDVNGYTLLLKKTAIQTFTIQPTKTNGYHDLVLGMHGSATDQELFLYQIHEGQYRKAACYDANWEHLGKDGEYHRLTEPRITSCAK